MIYIFEDYVLNINRRELRRGTKPVALEPQVFDFLVYLIANRERVVSKDDLIAAVWSGRIVSELAISSRITDVRKAIGDNGDDQRLIKTVSRKGIRFVGTVREQEESGGVVDVWAGAKQPHPSVAYPHKPSIAVLPFTNMSNDPEQEYFSEGITEDVITDLSKISGLHVVARNTVFTYKGKPIKVQQVAQELGVRFVLEGSVRKAGSRVRVTGQLIDSNDGAHVWADRYDRDLTDIFAIQDEITQAIVDQLKVRLLPKEKNVFGQVPTESIEAYAYYLRGRQFMHRRSKTFLELARRMFAKAVESIRSMPRRMLG